ncbi:hypothetical protein D3C80_2112790 [compost metagenome]
MADCFHVPQKKMAEQARMMMFDKTMQTTRARRDRNITSVSMPIWLFSRKVSTAPMKVSQTKKYRDNSSEILMPEFIV